jgi:CheY-like chemotaxis protein
MDGYDVVETIRQNEAGIKATRKKGDTIPHFPVVVLTADVQMAQRQTYLSHGFDECLLKPVSLGQFRRLLIRWGLMAGEEEEAVPAGDNTTATDNEALPPAIDLASMKELMGAIDDNAVQMMHMFADMTAPLVERLARARDNKDMHELREAGHSLKGAARSASCNILGDIAAQLQTDAEAGKDDCGALVNKIEVEFARVRKAIAELKPQE